MRFRCTFIICRYLSRLRNHFNSDSEFPLPTLQHRASFFLRSYSAEVQAQLSPELLNIMDQRLSAIEQPEASPSEYARANKELWKLSGSMDLIKELRAKQKEIDGLKSLIAECSEDKDMLNMATEEMGQAVEEGRRLQNFLLKSLLPKDDADERDCILEIGSGDRSETSRIYNFPRGRVTDHRVGITYTQ